MLKGKMIQMLSIGFFEGRITPETPQIIALRTGKCHLLVLAKLQADDRGELIRYAGCHTVDGQAVGIPGAAQQRFQTQFPVDFG